MSLTCNIDLVYLRQDIWLEITRKNCNFKTEAKHMDKRTILLPK